VATLDSSGPGVLQDLVQPLDLPAALLDLGLAVAGQLAQLADRAGRHKAGTDQTVLDQLADDLQPLLAGAGLRTPESSQWEGIDTDATGRVFVLREVPGTVLVFDQALETLVHVFPLTVEDDPAELEAWEADQNALGEGVLLLRNGHLFVVKEDKPRQLLEFGLPGAQAEGLRADLPIADTGEFPTPPESRAVFHLLSAWDLGGAAMERIGDLSDVTVGPDGRIYVLSDESRCIARLQTTLDPQDRLIEVDRIWGLPERLHQPEGLVITGDWEVLVAVDHPEPRQNLFLLRGLDT